MRERISAFAAAAALMLTLTACGDNNDTDTSGDSRVGTTEVQTSEVQTSEAWHETMEARRHIELSAVYDAIIAAQPADAEELVMFPEDGYSELVESLYPDMARFDYEQMVLYAPPVTGFPCEIMLVEAKYEVDADHAEEVFLNRIENGAADTTYPENAEGWVTRAEVQREGFYVAMIVLPEGYDIPRNVFDLVAE